MKTREVIAVLDITYYRLMSALRSGKIAPPEKDCSGDFNWRPKDIEAARRALAVDHRCKQGRKGVPA